MHDDDDKLWIRQQHKTVQHVAPVVEPLIRGEGFVLVDIRFNPAGGALLQVFIDHPSDAAFVDPATPQEPGSGVSLAELTDLTRLLSDALDVEEPVSGAYRLEVSSPGLERPLSWRSDFLRAVGLTIKLRCPQAVDGRRKCTGVLSAVEGEQLRLKLGDGAEIVIPVEAIGRAQLDFGPQASGRAAKGAGRAK